MEWIVVERNFEDPQTLSELRAKEDAARDCLVTWRVSWKHAYLSRDGRHMACLYQAPDAEAVRQTQRGAGLPFDHVYTCHRVVDEAIECPPGYSTVVAQRALPGLGLEVVQALAADPNGCNKRNRILHFGAFLSLDGTRMICTYHSPDLDSVRRANHSNGTPHEYLWLAERADAQAED